jgi:nucleoside-diphosphate-sugar epimerase
MDRVSLVTGGGGFIGRYLIRRLLLEGGAVRVLVRRPETLGPIRPHVEVVSGDVRDRSVVSRAAEGATVVYHLAGCARAWHRDPREFHTVNVDGLRNVLRAVRDRGACRVVHTSTVLTLLP